MEHPNEAANQSRIKEVAFRRVRVSDLLMEGLSPEEIATRLGWTPHLLDYRNSGDTAGDRRRVVGYAAVAYTAGD